MTGLRRRQRGYTAIIAVVLLVVIGIITSVVVTTGATQQVTSAISRDAIQAWFAARSGIEWGVRAAVNGSCAPTASVPLPGAAFSGFGDVVVTCTSSLQITEGATDYRVYHVTATASKGIPGNPGRVSRTIRANVTGPP